ncbi:hypothetical protein ACFQX6_26660 [Streptosporangium lutulentum]
MTTIEAVTRSRTASGILPGSGSIARCDCPFVVTTVSPSSSHVARPTSNHGSRAPPI